MFLYSTTKAYTCIRKYYLDSSESTGDLLPVESITNLGNKLTSTQIGITNDMLVLDIFKMQLQQELLHSENSIARSTLFYSRNCWQQN